MTNLTELFYSTNRIVHNIHTRNSVWSPHLTLKCLTKTCNIKSAMNFPGKLNAINIVPLVLPWKHKVTAAPSQLSSVIQAMPFFSLWTRWEWSIASQTKGTCGCSMRATPPAGPYTPRLWHGSPLITTAMWSLCYPTWPRWRSTRRAVGNGLSTWAVWVLGICIVVPK